MEVKARFDEANNILMARRLEKAGAHVIYGLVGLKTHSKCTLVIRREKMGSVVMFMWRPEIIMRQQRSFIQI